MKQNKDQQSVWKNVVKYGALLLFCALFPFMVTAADDQIELKFSHHNPPGGWTAKHWLNPWAKQIEEASKGKVKVTVYPARSLHGEKESVSALEYGITDMTWVVLGFFKGRFPLTEVMTLPFQNLPEGHVNGEKYSPGRINSRIAWELYEMSPEMQKEWKKVKVLFVLTSNPSFISTVNKPVRNLEDLKGLKLRALAGGQTDVLKALGASPVSMPIPEVYESAQRNIIDGMATNWTQISNFRLYEVFKYYTPINLTVDVFAVAMNKDKWNSLPDDVKKAIDSVSGLYGAEFGGDTAFGFELEESIAATMEKAGKKMTRVDLDKGERERWEKTGGTPLEEKWVANLKKKGLPADKVADELTKLLKKYR